MEGKSIDKRRNEKAKIPRRTESGRKEENMAKFKVGDRVRVISVGCRKIIEVGDAGTIKGCNALGNYAVEFDRQSSYFIRCDGLTKRDRGLWVSPEHLELIEEKPTREFKLIITSSGDTTTAKLIHGKDVAKEATVTRYSKDEYSEKAAVEAVTKKIFGEDEKKEELFNGKVVCLMDLTYIPKYTKGRVYEFVNGNCKDDYGNVINFRYTLE